MRIAAALVAALAAFAASAAEQARFDPQLYLLTIDRAQYALDRKVDSFDSASAGASRSYATPAKAGGSDLALPADCPDLRRPDRGDALRTDNDALRIREREHEYRIRELERELEAWRSGRAHSGFLLPPAGRFR